MNVQAVRHSRYYGAISFDGPGSNRVKAILHECWPGKRQFAFERGKIVLVDGPFLGLNIWLPANPTGYWALPDVLFIQENAITTHFYILHPDVYKHKFSDACPYVYADAQSIDQLRFEVGLERAAEVMQP